MGRTSCVLVAALLLHTLLELSCAQVAAPAPSALAPAPAPAAPIQSAASVAASLFPRLPNSFTNKAENAVIEWNIALQWVSRNDNESNVVSRALAVQSMAIWKAVQYNELQAEPADETAVVGYAGHLMLMNFFPKYFSQYDQLLQAQIAGLSADECAYAKAISAVPTVAFLASRLNDGSQSLGIPLPTTAPPGQFQSISSSGNYRAFTQYALTAPFCLSKNDSQAAKDGYTSPYEYPSQAYNTEYTAVYLLGGVNSTLRVGSQTDTANFWGDAGTGIVAHWNQLAITTLPANASIRATAELLALINACIFDSVAISYSVKFSYKPRIDIWRPITAINLGDSSHVADPNWVPLLQTPNNPGAPASQTALAGAAITALQSFYGTDKYSFSLGSEYNGNGVTLTPRTYFSFSSAATEVTESRYLGGTEFKADSQVGLTFGQEIGELCLERFYSIPVVVPLGYYQ